MNKLCLHNPLLQHRKYLYFTEFIVGLSVMAVELGASRLLAPFFSSSQIVWTIIIGMIMVAMALGNLYGGKNADKNPNPNWLFSRIAIASLWLALIPVLGKYVIILVTNVCTASIDSNFLIIATFISTTILFIFPLFLLGTVTPSLVKYSVNDLNENATIVGRLYAFNTVGCIIGTFTPTFITIPIVGTSMTFLIFSGLLLIIASVYFVFEIRSHKAKRVQLVICLIGSLCVYLTCCFFGAYTSYANNTDNVTYEGESAYNYILVREDNDQINLATNLFFGVQSIHNKNNDLTGAYYDYALAAPLMSNINNKNSCDILILGNATGTYASLCKKFFGGKVNIDAVEIDKKISEIGYELFDMPRDINVYNYDGRAYLNATDKVYDVIMVDAYQDFAFPFHMSTSEFFVQVQNHLKDDGVMVANIISSKEDTANFQQYMPDTIATAFDNVYCVKVGWTPNIEVFASNNGNMQKGLKQENWYQHNTKFSQIIKNIRTSLKKHNPGGYVFTDDKSPVEYIAAKSMNDNIKESIKTVEYLRE